MRLCEKGSSSAKVIGPVVLAACAAVALVFYFHVPEPEPPDGRIIATVEIRGKKGRTESFDIAPDVRYILAVYYMYSPAGDFVRMNGKCRLVGPGGSLGSWTGAMGRSDTT